MQLAQRPEEQQPDHQSGNEVQTWIKKTQSVLAKRLHPAHLHRKVRAQQTGRA